MEIAWVTHRVLWWKPLGTVRWSITRPVTSRISDEEKEEEKGKEKNKSAADHLVQAKEVLDFQFDNELDNPWRIGRHNAFPKWSKDDDDYEISDTDTNKLLIVTQPASLRIHNHEEHCTVIFEWIM